MPALRDNQMTALRAMYGGTKALEDYLHTFETQNPTFAGIGRYSFYTTALTAAGVTYAAGSALNDLAQLYWSTAAFNPMTAITWWASAWASDPSWTPPADGATVSSWRVGGSAGLTPMVPINANLPIYKRSVSQLNNRPAVDSNAANNELRSGSGVGPGIPDTLVFIGRRVGAGGGANERMMDATSSGSQSLIMNYPTVGKFGVYAGTGITDGNYDTNAHLITALVAAAAGGNIVVDNGTPVTGTTGILGATNLAFPGQNGGVFDYGNVQAAFLGVYTGNATTDTAWTSFKQWVRVFYNITIA